MRTPRTSLLHALLTPLVAEWGLKEVRLCLDAMERGAAAGKGSDHQPTRGAPPANKIDKVTALGLASRLTLPPEHKELIEDLAARFDAKAFLPGAGDVRHFLELNHETASAVKQRSEAFRKVLKVLARMPTESLKQLVAQTPHSGPARLGPISQAMREVGNQRRAHGSETEVMATQASLRESGSIDKVLPDVASTEAPDSDDDAHAGRS